MENVRENFAKPRAACKNELPRGHPFTIAGGHLWHAAGSCRSLDLRAAVLRAKAYGLFDHESHGAPRQQYAAVRFQEPALDAIEPHLPIATLESRAVQLLEPYAAALESRAGLL